MPPITLYFLQASRCIRTAWLLEELGLDYELVFSDRVNQKAPEDFKLASGNPLGKFPTIKDGKLTIGESGAINEYVSDTFDRTNSRVYLAFIVICARHTIKKGNCFPRIRLSASKSVSGFMRRKQPSLYTRWPFFTQGGMSKMCPKVHSKQQRSAWLLTCRTTCRGSRLSFRFLQVSFCAEIMSQPRTL